MTTNYETFANAKGFTYRADVISWLSDYYENEIGSVGSLFFDENDFNASMAILLRYHETH